MTVENLDIQISQRGANASAQMERLANSIGKIKAPTASVSKGIKKLSSSFSVGSTAIGKFVKSLGRIAFYRAIRTIVKEITQSFKEGLVNAYHFSKGLNGSLAAALDGIATKSLTMKNQLGSAFGGLLQAIQPILLRIISLITQAANAIAAFFGALNGGTYLKAKDTAAAWDEATGAANKYKNTILGFDEINRLDDQGGGGGGVSPNYNDMFEVAEVPAGIQKIADFVDTLRQKIEENLAAIEFAASTASLAIGLILALSGANIPLGLGLIAVGAIGMAKSLNENWDKIPSKTKEIIVEIGVAVGSALLAIGAVLAFSGANIPLGIGMMAAGVVGIASAALMWDKLPSDVQRTVSKLMLIIGGASLAVGVVLACTGVALPLAIGLIAAGATSLGTAAALNWEFLSGEIRNFIASVRAILSAASTVLGIILCLNPETLPLGIGLLKAGMEGSVKAFNLQDNAVTKKVLSFCQTIEGYINTYLIDPLNKVLGLFNSIFNTDWNIKSLSNSINGVATSGKTTVGKFADGGFPSRGDLFIAGEAGAELVSSHNGQTQVSNTDQIAASVQFGNGVVVQAIYDMANTLAQTINAKDTNPVVTIGDREVYRAAQRGGRAVGGSLVNG